MWELQDPKRVKLIIGILASDNECMDAAVKAVKERFGEIDLQSDTWDFTQTKYYNYQMGENILRKFVSLKKTISPGRLAKIKLKTNKMEQELAQSLNKGYSRPVNLDPGYVEPSKLVLASAKNFSHRIYIGKKIYAEVTLLYDKGWKAFDHTFPDYQTEHYQKFLSQVRERISGAKHK